MVLERYLDCPSGHQIWWHLISHLKIPEGGDILYFIQVCKQDNGELGKTFRGEAPYSIKCSITEFMILKAVTLNHIARIRREGLKAYGLPIVWFRQYFHGWWHRSGSQCCLVYNNSRRFFRRYMCIHPIIETLFFLFRHNTSSLASWRWVGDVYTLLIYSWNE